MYCIMVPQTHSVHSKGRSPPVATSTKTGFGSTGCYQQQNEYEFVLTRILSCEERSEVKNAIKKKISLI